MNGERVVIKIFYGMDGNCMTCSGGCGAAGKGIEAAAEEIAEKLKGKYGDRVSIELVDVFSVNLNEYPQVIAAIKDGYDMPIITFNDRPRLSAAINLEDIEEILDEMGVLL